MPESENTVEVDATTLAHLTEVGRRYRGLLDTIASNREGDKAKSGIAHDINEISSEIEIAEDALEEAGLI